MTEQLDKRIVTSLQWTP